MFDVASSVQTEKNDNQSDSMIGKTPAQWGEIFKSDLAALKKMDDAFKAMNYIIMNLFPAMEGYTTAVMGTEAVAMQAVSNALKQLNSIKADFNSCQDPSYWEKNTNSNALFEKINKLVEEVQTDPALKGIKSTVIQQLQVITHGSANPGMWTSKETRNGLEWTFNNVSRKWWIGKKLQHGTLSSYIEWMWTQEWQGKSSVPSSFYRVTLWRETQNGPLWVTIYDMTSSAKDGWESTRMPLKTCTINGNKYPGFEEYVQKMLKDKKPIFNFQNGVESPVYLKDGNLNYWNGKKWVNDVSHQDYYNFVLGKIASAKQQVEEQPPGQYDYTDIEIGLTPPEKLEKENPEYTTGPTTQAFAAISTTLNSQSSVAQSKFKYLQSNEQEFLGIQHGTMSQIVKVEETMTRQMATH